MTEVAFHFNIPDKPAYLCRLLRKVTQARRRALVCGPAALLQDLDQGLWTFSAEDFVSHATVQDPPQVQQRSAVILSERPEPSLCDDVLVNCLPDVPRGFEGYARLIEVVGLDEADRAQARTRWKQYLAAGITPLRHDIAVKGG